MLQNHGLSSNQPYLPCQGAGTPIKQIAERNLLNIWNKMPVTTSFGGFHQATVKQILF
ncbi:MAG: hypothetical protein GXY54_12000 [Deltaproteobacteria bacterium]|nr:hypothetical protein [Deltaproteobacteria bacterium]